MIGRFLCRVRLHRWNYFEHTEDRSNGMLLQWVQDSWRQCKRCDETEFQGRTTRVYV